MKRLRISIGVLVAVATINCISWTETQPTTPTTIHGYITAAMTAERLDWSGAFPRSCMPPAPAAAGARGAAPARSPARETWYAEPAKVADNLYFLGTKVHNAWAIVGSEGTIVLEALFDYAAQDEIIGGMKKLGLDTSKIKYVILSHAHADHDGGEIGRAHV